MCGCLAEIVPFLETFGIGYFVKCAWLGGVSGAVRLGHGEKSAGLRTDRASHRGAYGGLRRATGRTLRRQSIPSETGGHGGAAEQSEIRGDSFLLEGLGRRSSRRTAPMPCGNRRLDRGLKMRVWPSEVSVSLVYCISLK